MACQEWTAGGWSAAPRRRAGAGQVGLAYDGRGLLERIAAGHVAEVRRRVFDSPSTDDVEHLRRSMEKVLANLPG